MKRLFIAAFVLLLFLPRKTESWRVWALIEGQTYWFPSSHKTREDAIDHARTIFTQHYGMVPHPETGVLTLLSRIGCTKGAP